MRLTGLLSHTTYVSHWIAQVFFNLNCNNFNIYLLNTCKYHYINSNVVLKVSCIRSHTLSLQQFSSIVHVLYRQLTTVGAF